MGLRCQEGSPQKIQWSVAGEAGFPREAQREAISDHYQLKWNRVEENSEQGEYEVVHGDGSVVKTWNKMERQNPKGPEQSDTGFSEFLG